MVDLTTKLYALIRKAQQAGVELDTGNVNDFCLDNVPFQSEANVRDAVRQLIDHKMVDIKEHNGGEASGNI